MPRNQPGPTLTGGHAGPRGTLTPFDGVFADPDAIAALGDWFDETAPLSPSVLETYALCPYRFFLERLLRVKRLEEPETIIELDALTRGKVIHEVLETFLSDHAPDDLRTTDRSTLQAALREIADRLLAEVEDAGLAGAPITWARARTEIVDDLARWLDNEIAKPGAYPERAFEVAFGGTYPGKDESPYSTDEPLELDVGGRAVPLRGRIDRLEWEPGGTFRIIDYKTGRNRLKGVFDGGRALQLALYLLAAAKHRRARRRERHRRPTSSRPGAATSARTPSQGAISQRSRATSTRCSVGSSAESPPATSTLSQAQDSCRFCDFQTVCDVRRYAIAERKSADDRRVSFAEMKDIP